MLFVLRALVVALVLLLIQPCAAQSLRFTNEGLSSADNSRATLAAVKTPHGPGIAVSFELAADGWVNASARLPATSAVRPATFVFNVTTACTLELKFVEANGSTYGQRVRVEPTIGEFRRLTIYPDEAEHFWGDKGKRGRAVSFEVAVSGTTGAGTLTIARPRLGKKGEPSSFGPVLDSRNEPSDSGADDAPLLRVPHNGPLLDPDRHLPGYGTAQRRAKTMTPEDPLVLEWLKQMQDTGTPERQLLPSTPGGDQGHTFNNVLAAMAFIRHGERERAERILDFFRDATVDRDNEDPTAQRFYLRGETRGFFQHVSLGGRDGVSPMHAPPDVDRWMGDMAWLTLACLDHERTFGDQRYASLKKSLTDLLRSWYTANPRGEGGYVQHGWRKGDSHLHEDHGHHEGNIDCYALFTLLGEKELAEQIRSWLEAELAGRNDLPLDLYTWRVLALDGQQAELLDVPDFDLRFRKAVSLRGRTIVGVFSAPAADVENLWIEGAAHMSCAYAAAGNLARANFYANQLDGAIIEQQLTAMPSHSLPYTANGAGGYEWVNPDEGFTSTAAWYILAKQRFNPLRLKIAESTGKREHNQ